MARSKQDETITERIEACARSTARVRDSIAESVKRLSEMERHLPVDANILAMYKLLLRGIEQEIKYL